jgi:hypothetical protein
MMIDESPIRTSPCSIQGDLPFGPLRGSFSMTISWSSLAIRSQVTSLSGNGPDVGNGTPQPVPNTKTRTFFPSSGMKAL